LSGHLLDKLKLIVRLEMFFVTTLKHNRLVSLSKETGYVPFRVQLFKVVATNGEIEWVISG